MPTRAELNAIRDERDTEMILLIHQGKTARQIAAILGVTSSTIRGRADGHGLQCERVHRRGPVPTRMEEAAKPCKHPPAECKSVSCLGHRFGPDLTCTCGVEWHTHQRDGLSCEDAKEPERKYPDQLENRTHCCNGHPWTDVYRYPNGKEECNPCRRANESAYYLRQKEKK